MSTRKIQHLNFHFHTKNQLHNKRSVIKLQIRIFTHLYHISTCALQLTIRKHLKASVAGNLHRQAINQRVDPNQ